MKCRVSNYNVSLIPARNNNSGFDSHLQNGRRLHDEEIGRLIWRYIAKFFEFFGKEHYFYHGHAGSRA